MVVDDIKPGYDKLLLVDDILDKLNGISDHLFEVKSNDKGVDMFYRTIKAIKMEYGKGAYNLESTTGVVEAEAEWDKAQEDGESEAKLVKARCKYNFLRDKNI